MKRLHMAVTSVFLVSDEVENKDSTLQSDLEIAVFDAVSRAVSNIEGVTLDTVIHGRNRIEDARMGVCKVGDHPFAMPYYFKPEQQVPDICQAHAYAEAMDEARADHQPLFDLVEQLTGLKKAWIWQSGGMTMTMVIPLSTANDAPPDGPCYLGLCEFMDEETGRRSGGLAYCPSGIEDEEPDNFWSGYSHDGADLPIEGWAQQIADHYASLKRR